MEKKHASKYKIVITNLNSNKITFLKVTSRFNIWVSHSIKFRWTVQISKFYYFYPLPLLFFRSYWKQSCATSIRRMFAHLKKNTYKQKAIQKISLMKNQSFAIYILNYNSYQILYKFLGRIISFTLTIFGENYSDI